MLDNSKFYSFPIGLNSLEKELAHSNRWKLFYSNSDDVSYRLVSPPRPS
jgi:hypothetical protein